MGFASPPAFGYDQGLPRGATPPPRKSDNWCFAESTAGSEGNGTAAGAREIAPIHHGKQIILMTTFTEMVDNAGDFI